MKEEEIFEKIARIERVQEEDSRMIRSLYNAMRLGRAFKIFYILLILSAVFGLYYYIQPYVGDLVDVYLGTQNALDILKTVPK